MLEVLFIVAFITYLSVMVLLGYMNRSGRSLSNFFLASRSLGSNSVGLSLGATVIGGSAVIVTCSLVFNYGLVGLWYDIGAITGLMILGLWLGPKVRATGAHSLPDLIGKAYGNSGKVSSSILLVAVEIGWIALLLQASGFVISEATGLGMEFTMLIATMVFIAYTALGGQMAVVKTDKVQIGFIVLSLFAILFALISSGATMPGSGIRFPVTGDFGPSMVISAFLVMFLSNLVGPDIYSKLFSAKDPGNAGKGSIIAGSLRLIVSLTVGTIALLGVSYYGDQVSGATLLPYAAKDLLPPFVSVIVIIGLLSIMISSADSCLLSGATFISWDLVNSRKVWVRTMAIFGLGTGAFILAFYSPGIIETLTLTYTVFSAGMVPAVILLFFKDRLRLNKWGAISSFLVGGLSVIVLFILQNHGMWEMSLLFGPLILSTATILLVSQITVRILSTN